MAKLIKKYKNGRIALNIEAEDVLDEIKDKTITGAELTADEINSKIEHIKEYINYHIEILYTNFAPAEKINSRSLGICLASDEWGIKRDNAIKKYEYYKKNYRSVKRARRKLETLKTDFLLHIRNNVPSEKYIETIYYPCLLYLQEIYQDKFDFLLARYREYKFELNRWWREYEYTNYKFYTRDISKNNINANLGGVDNV